MNEIPNPIDDCGNCAHKFSCKFSPFGKPLTACEHWMCCYMNPVPQMVAQAHEIQQNKLNDEYSRLTGSCAGGKMTLEEKVDLCLQQIVSLTEKIGYQDGRLSSHLIYGHYRVDPKNPAPPIKESEKEHLSLSSTCAMRDKSCDVTMCEACNAYATRKKQARPKC